MAKKITKKVKEEVGERGEIINKDAEPKEEKTSIAPELKGEAIPNTAPETGKFYALEVEGGAVIINPVGKRVSKVMRKDKAETDAMRMN
jgi:hypothetical protein